MERMPVYRSQDKIRIHWLASLCAIDALYGLINVFGKSEGASQVLLRNYLPTPVWAVLLVTAAVLVWFGWSVPGAASGAFVWTILTAASAATIGAGTALSYSGWVLYGGMAWWHVLILYDVGSGLDEDRELRQRR